MVEVVLMPIIINKHFHLLDSEKDNKEYLYYSLVPNPLYDTAMNEMVSLELSAWFPLQIGTNNGFVIFFFFL